MAKRTMTRKITRRDAVALLGAGTMMGAVRAPASSGGQPDNHPSCNTPATVGTYQGTREAIVSYSCCEETKNALLVGVEEPSIRPTRRGKTHLKPLRDRLTADNLLEYCFMVWGLTQEDVQKLYKSVPDQLGLKPTKRDAPK